MHCVRIDIKRLTSHSMTMRTTLTFRPDELSLAEAIKKSGVESRLVGHQQVTDDYLLGLARNQSDVLATLDTRIASLTGKPPGEPKVVELLSGA